MAFRLVSLGHDASASGAPSSRRRLLFLNPWTEVQVSVAFRRLCFAQDASASGAPASGRLLLFPAGRFLCPDRHVHETGSLSPRIFGAGSARSVNAIAN